MFAPGMILADCSLDSLDKIVRSVALLHESDHELVESSSRLIDAIVCAAVGIDGEDLKEITKLRMTWPRDRLSVDGLLSGGTLSPQAEIARAISSFLVGVCFGRWDPAALVKRPQSIWPDSFDELPSRPPSTVKGGELSGAAMVSVIFADEGSLGSLGHSMRDALSLALNRDASQMEQELCSALGFRSFQEYVCRAGGFFADHLETYSKSRRKAPIYWPLSTTSGSYTLWVYYPNLNSQTLYTAINDFVEPKLKQVGEDVAALRNKGGARTQEDEKQFEALQSLEGELQELRDKLHEIAPGYKPNHGDGVQITAAPLWPLFRHKPWQKVLKDTWAKMEKGDYNWAHLAMAYWPERVREKCKTDKSLAIAHGLEELYIEPEVAPKKTRGRKKAGGEE
jgi:hypothetical protein